MFVTFADRQGAAPLSIKSALSTSVSTEDVTSVTGEVDNIIEVELAAIGSPVGWVPGVTTSNSWGSGEKYDKKLEVWRKYDVQHCDLFYTWFFVTVTTFCCWIERNI